VEDICALVRLNYEGRVKFIDNQAEILPGIAVEKVGGHTAGMQIVTVSTGRGRAVVASDASHYYRNLEERIPFNTLHDLPGTYAAFDRIREIASAPELIVPGHDPLVLDRLRPVRTISSSCDEVRLVRGAPSFRTPSSGSAVFAASST
jgi:glyoxylase-like metal-dependent hydrolase (beta-lactamase superfamily II)